MNAGSIVWGNCDKASWNARKYIVDLSLNVMAGPLPDEPVNKRYLYVVGIVAWYCASMAKRIAVGPAGRWFNVFKDSGRTTIVRIRGGRRVVNGRVLRIKLYSMV